MFHNFVKGDLSVSDYCRKMKSMTDSLADLGCAVFDRNLVLNILWAEQVVRLSWCHHHTQHVVPVLPQGLVRAGLGGTHIWPRHLRSLTGILLQHLQIW
jgi:hypothetical protein